MSYTVYFGLSLSELVFLSLAVKTVLIHAHSKKDKKMKKWTQAW